MSFLSSLQIPFWTRPPQTSQPSADLTLPSHHSSQGDHPLPPISSSPAPTKAHQNPVPQPSTPSENQLSPLGRHAKQLSLFLFGAGFLAASVTITRRAVLRRQTESYPKFWTSNRHPIFLDPTDRQLLAVQAFGLATLNVMSFGVMLTGGIGWGFDLCNLRELRERTRESLRRGAAGLQGGEEGQRQQQEEGERALEAMMDDLLKKLGIERPVEGEEDGQQDMEKNDDQTSLSEVN